MWREARHRDKPHLELGARDARGRHIDIGHEQAARDELRRTIRLAGEEVEQEAIDGSAIDGNAMSR